MRELTNRNAQLADIENENRRAEWHASHDGLIGKTEDDVIAIWGAPDKIETAGSFRIFYYFLDQGTSSRDAVGAWETKVVTSRHYHKTTFFFKDAKCAKWDHESQ